MLVRGKSKVITTTVDALAAGGAYASGDVIGTPQKLAKVVMEGKGTAVLQSLVAIDKGDTGAAMDLYFFDTLPTSQGADNAALAISDAEMLNCVGHVSIGSSDWVDIGGARVATKTGIGLLIQTVATVQDIWMVSVARGAVTFANNDVQVRSGWLQD